MRVLHLEKAGRGKPNIWIEASDVADTKKLDTNIVGYQRVGFGSVRIV